MRLENTRAQAALKEAEAMLQAAQRREARLLAGSHPEAIKAAEAKLIAMEARVKLANQAVDRAHGSKQAVSQATIDEAEMQAAATTAETASAHAELHSLIRSVRPEDRALAAAEVAVAQAAVTAATAALNDHEVRAPCAGMVLEILRREGEAVTVTGADAVMIFADVEHLRVRAELNENLVSHLKEGQHVTLRGPNLGGKNWKGTVARRKQIMGQKRLFAQTAKERRDLDVLEFYVTPEAGFTAPVGLQVDVVVMME
jgi:multidrug resistance efflux pump